MKLSPRLRKWGIRGAAILLIALVCLLWFRRNYHFHFDSHHLYEKATFGQWVVGWFGDFDHGPLTATLISAPASKDNGFTKYGYRWHLSQSPVDADIVAWIETPEGLCFVLSRVGNSREFLAHAWSGASWSRFDYQVTARHVGNQRELTTTPTDRIRSPDQEVVSLVAWKPTWIELEEGQWSGPVLGDRLRLPGKQPITDWVLQFAIEAEGDAPGDRLIAEYVLGFNDRERGWKILSRDFRELRGIDSWIDPARQQEISHPEGFDLTK